MERFINRTEEEDAAFARRVAQYTVEEMMKKIPKREPLYNVNSPEVKAAFPTLSENTLRNWCRNGKLGKFGQDKAYHVKLSEIESFLLSK
jgi:broad specificity polyphosphatase/5'/3'-nucleotidase SurE